VTESTYAAEVVVFLKPGVNDPEGLAIKDGLHSLGYTGVETVRAGKYLRLVVRAGDAEAARASVAAMCDQLLSNPVIENYRITVQSQAAE